MHLFWYNGIHAETTLNGGGSLLVGFTKTKQMAQLADILLGTSAEYSCSLLIVEELRVANKLQSPICCTDKVVHSFEILVLFQELFAQGRTIICVTHNPEIAQYSSRNIVLRDGQVKEDVQNTNILSAAEALAALPPIEE